MKVLNISSNDLTGSRFNGYYIRNILAKEGIESSHCVWDKESNDENVWKLVDSPVKDSIRELVSRTENLFSLQSLLYPFPFKLFFDERFLAADIIHMHLIHTGYFNLFALPLISLMKPTVWTLHDPWAITGHCVHPYDCEKWKNGCRGCPYLNTHFALRRDNSALLWKLKKFLYKYSRFHVVVASEWMKKKADASPLLSTKIIHKVPFGLNVSKFRPKGANYIRRSFGIGNDEIVIGVRAAMNEFKGFKYALNALKQLHSDRKISILTFNDKGLCGEIKDKFKVIELGWIGAEDEFINALNAMDIMLMPSIGETFGMTAIEAMACGKPIVCFDNTSLPEIIEPLKGGIAVPFKDTYALAEALKELIESDEKRLAMGKTARDIAIKNYNVGQYAKETVKLYKSIHTK